MVICYIHKCYLSVIYQTYLGKLKVSVKNFLIPHLRHDLDATVHPSEKESVATPPVLLTTVDLPSESSQEDIKPIPAHLIPLIPENPIYEGGYLN
ncbi:unnamed protein product [Rhizophagus irregularis]|nr:unnamed protein product [Rhizophagus irregularis]